MAPIKTARSPKWGDGFCHQTSAYISFTDACSIGLNADGVHRQDSTSQKKADYWWLQQMPVPVNNVTGKRQLNDQTYYSSWHIKALRDTGVSSCVCLWRGGLRTPLSASVSACKCVCGGGVFAHLYVCAYAGCSAEEFIVATAKMLWNPQRPQ